jgi:hypothetical protein
MIATGRSTSGRAGRKERSVGKNATHWNGKAGLGYRVMTSGPKKAYLSINIPHGMGLRKGERVRFQTCIREGVDGIWLTKVRASQPSSN